MAENIKSAELQKIKRMESLDALRGIAFLGIFFLHTSFCLQWASLGVSIFFVISGFLMSCQHYNDSEILLGGGYRFSLNYAAKHIVKIYPLHISTMLLAFCLMECYWYIME